MRFSRLATDSKVFSKLLSRSLLVSILTLPALGLGAGTALAFDADSDSITDEADAFPCNSGSAAVLFSPAQGDFGLTLFEDQWPGDSDLDFNDAVIASNYIFEMTADGRVRSMRANYNVLAVGGVYNNGLGLRLAGVPSRAVASIRQTVAGQAPVALNPQASDPDNLTVRIVSNLRDLFGGQEGTINSDPALASRSGQAVELEITFLTPQAIDTGAAPFDLYIFRSQTPEHEIHRPGYPGTAEMDQDLFGSGNDGSTLGRHFIDHSGLPYALYFPTLRPWPQEGVAIHHLYPNIVQFAASGGTQAPDFYSSALDLGFAYGWSPLGDVPPEEEDNFWFSPVQTSFVGPSTIPADTGCVDAWGLSVTYGTGRDTFGYDSTLDASGNMVITGYTNHSFASSNNNGLQDFFVAKYNRMTGALVWSRVYGGSGAEAGRAITTDAADNIYVVGETRSSFGGQGNAGQYDAFLTKLDPSGNVLWTRLLGGSGYDRGLGIALDSSGSIYLCGGSDSSNLPGASYTGPSAASFVAKYDTNGNRLWTQQFRTDQGAPANYSYGSALTVDASGNLFLVGSERRYNSHPSAAENGYVAKLSASDGSVSWINHLGDYGYYNGSSDFRFGHALAVAADGSGSAYISGTWESGSLVPAWGGLSRLSGDRSADMTLTKVDGAGAVLWERSVGSTGAGDDYVQSVKLDASGNVYMVGYSSGSMPGTSSQGGYDYWLARFDRDGTRQWLVQRGSSADDAGFGLAIDSSLGAAFIAGNSGNVSGVPLAYQSYYYGFIARHNLSDGSQLAFIPTIDTTIVTSGCLAIKQADPSAQSGVYTIDADSNGSSLPFDVYCEMSTDGGGWTRVEQSQNSTRITNTGEQTPAALLSASTTTYAKLSDTVIRQLALSGLREYMMTARNTATIYILRASDSEWNAFSSTGWTNMQYDSKRANGTWAVNACNGHYNNRGFSSISDSPSAWGGCPVYYSGPARYLASNHTTYNSSINPPFFVYVR